MLRVFWANLSTVAVHMRECLSRHGLSMRRRRVQSSEEVVADLYTYLEQLNAKCGELEAKVQRCNQRALFHRQRAHAEPTQHCKQRELRRAKLYLQDKHRVQEDQDRTLRFMHLIRQQIDSLTSSQMDNLMVDAMRQYNMTAKRMGLPDKTREIEALSGELQQRFTEVEELQHLLSDTTDPFATGLLKAEDDDDLMAELAALGGDQEEEEEQKDRRIMVPASSSSSRDTSELRQRIVAMTITEEDDGALMMQESATVAVGVSAREEEALLV